MLTLAGMCICRAYIPDLVPKVAEIADASVRTDSSKSLLMSSCGTAV